MSHIVRDLCSSCRLLVAKCQGKVLILSPSLLTYFVVPSSYCSFFTPQCFVVIECKFAGLALQWPEIFCEIMRCYINLPLQLFSGNATLAISFIRASNTTGSKSAESISEARQCGLTFTVDNGLTETAPTGINQWIFGLVDFSENEMKHFQCEYMSEEILKDFCARNLNFITIITESSLTCYLVLHGRFF